MRGSEGIVHVDVGVDAVHQLLHELGLVLGLARVETDVLQQNDVTVLHRADSLLDALANNLVHLRHLLSDELGESGGHGVESELGIGTLGLSQVRHENNLRSLLREELQIRGMTRAYVDRGQRLDNTRIIGDRALSVLRQRNIEIHSHKDSLSLKISASIGSYGNAVSLGVGGHSEFVDGARSREESLRESTLKVRTRSNLKYKHSICVDNESMSKSKRCHCCMS